MSKTRIVVLQHPQEARNEKNTAKLLSLTVSNAVHKVGLSWPSLNRILGERAEASKWGILFLGTGEDKKRKGNKVINLNPNQPPGHLPLEGIIVLDGNWKQAKALWWRNPWMMKFKRVLLEADTTSLYGTVRKQPRVDCLSTLESVTEMFRALGESDGLISELRKVNQEFVNRLSVH